MKNFNVTTSTRACVCFILFMPFLLSTSTLAQMVETPEALHTRIDRYFSAGVENGFSGAILVSHNGETLINKGYGLADKKKKTLNSATTVFDIGSNTKQFTGAAILKLVQYKKLAVSDPIGKYFSGIPADMEQITIYHLLTHSAGFVESIGRDFDLISTEDFFKALFNSELQFEPGTQYSYSNTGYSILARIIELVSGESYESFLRNHLLKPAGVEQTGYLLPKWDTEKLARGYNRNIMDVGSMVKQYQEDGEISWHLKGNGGIYSTQQDMSKWLTALKNRTVFPDSLFQEFTAPRIGPESGTFKYAFGWGVRTTERNTVRLSHNGSNGAFSHTILWLPEEDVQIIYATNANSPLVERLAYTVMDMLFKKGFTPSPIQKNVYFFTREFTRLNLPKHSRELLEQLKTNYKDDIQSPHLLNRLGYIALREDTDPAWAVALFKLNSGLFPEEWNMWDSLGDGYIAAGENKSAINSYRQAIKLGSDVSSEKLEKLLLSGEK